MTDHSGEIALPTCSVSHPIKGPCNLPADHRGAHRVTKVVAAYEYVYFGTNEPGYDTVTGVAIDPPRCPECHGWCEFAGGFVVCTPDDCGIEGPHDVTAHPKEASDA